MSKTLTITMLKDWPKPIWLKQGEQYELDYHLATMLIGLKKAKFDGEATELFQGFNENTADSQERKDFIW